MSIIAAALRELIAAGVTGDALVTAIERIEIASRPQKTPGALRQQRYRERHKASQSVTSDKSYIDIEVNTSSEIQKKERKISTPMRNDASPSDADRVFASLKGWDAARIDAEWQRFRDHAIANDRRQKDWPAAWRNWVTSPYQQRGNINGKGANLMDAFDDLIGRAAGKEICADPPIRDITPGGTDAG